MKLLHVTIRTNRFTEELIRMGLEVSPMISPAPQVHFFFVKDPAGVNVQFM